MMIPGTKMARNDNGFLVFSLYSFFLNKAESGDGSASVSLRKMFPTSQAASKNTEQIAQGRK